VDAAFPKSAPICSSDLAAASCSSKNRLSMGKNYLERRTDNTNTRSR